MSTPPPTPSSFGDPERIPPPAPPLPPDGPPGFGFAVRRRRNDMAVTSFVLSLVSVLMCCLLPVQVGAIVCGLVAIRRCRVDPTYSGKGLAIAGIAIAAATAILLVSFVGYWLAFGIDLGEG